MARKITPIQQTEPKWHGVPPPTMDRQDLIEDALNDGAISEDEAKALAEFSDGEVVSHLRIRYAEKRDAFASANPHQENIVLACAMSLDAAIRTFEVQHLLWQLSHRVMQVRDTHKRMTEYGREVYDHAHRIGSIDGPRPMAVYSPDAISEYNRACSEYRIAADIIHSALSHFGVGEEDRKTLIERAITSGLLKYR